MRQLQGLARPNNKTTDTLSSDAEWEDVEVTKVCEVPPPKRLTRECTKEQIDRQTQATRDKVLKAGLFSKLNYVCMQDIEKQDTLPSGRQVLANPNAVVDISTMRENVFQLQNVRRDGLKGMEDLSDNASEGVIMTRQKVMWPGQLVSLILAKGTKVKVMRCSNPEEEDESQQDIVIGEEGGKTVETHDMDKGHVVGMQVDDGNNIHILYSLGFY